MKVLFAALFLFVSVALACDDVASGPYTCTFGGNGPAEVFVDLVNNEITVDYADETCNYFGTVFMNDEDLIVTNVKCLDATDCAVNYGFDCLPYTIENIVFEDEEECTSFDANNEETDAAILCNAEFRRPNNSDSSAGTIVPFISMIAVALLALA